jgi:selenocysteine lyase/cysteine desulfurase
MPLSRRAVLSLAGVAALPMLPRGAAAASAHPDFPFEGTYLDAAFTHPVGRFAAEAAALYTEARLADPQAVGPGRNARRGAVERFARLINADPADIAVVPSTMDGENLVNEALGIGVDAGVVTDALHYDGSLALYGELKRRGAPVGVAPASGGSVDLAAIRDLIGPKTRLVAVSLVSSTSGFTHDLAELCAVAHARGALVYADIIQAAGAVAIDVRASGVDFACCGTYKWLMGDFGTAFLYVRPDRLERLERVEVGWRQVGRQESHALPFEPPGPLIDDFDLRPGAAGLFEVSTPAWGALAVAQASLDHLLTLGAEAIERQRQPLLQRLREALPPKTFVPLTPPGTRGPILAFAVQNAEARFSARLRVERIRVSLYRHRIRVSPSIYNSPDDVDRLIAALTSSPAA